ncbi:MAG TPA: hypothetical protein VLE73_05645 [Candidatus Saccharimonadales bacterium]|nr:hypothetical protein [Candidatus Saccharimonadales bacterium]
MNAKEQKELALSKLLLLVLAVIGLLLVIWLAWLRPAADSIDAASTRATAADNGTQSSAKDQAYAYLVIKEWRMRFRLNNSTQGAYYVPSASSPDRTVYISMHALEATDNCAADKVSLGAFGRFEATDTDPASGLPMTQLYPDAKQVGEYHYYYSHPQAACSDNAAVLEKANKAIEGFTAIVTTAQHTVPQ